MALIAANFLSRRSAVVSPSPKILGFSKCNVKSSGMLVAQPLRALSFSSPKYSPPPSGPKAIQLELSDASGSNHMLWLALGVAGATLGSYSLLDCKEVDYAAVRKDLAALLTSNPAYDDGSYGPLFIRLAWHASGSYDGFSKTGGSNGATMRFPPECNIGANKGLELARNLLEPLKQKYGENLSYADLWTLAGVVAVESMGGPKVPWRPGRTDVKDASSVPPDGRLPDASKGAAHIREIFSRMGFSDKEMVALIGAHAVGRCHTNRSGYTGPWTQSPTVFSNDYYRQLIETKWTRKNWKGPLQYEDPSGELMMLPADLALISDPVFKEQVTKYAADEELFFKDFAAAFGKLLELGVPFKEQKAWYRFW